VRQDSVGRALEASPHVESHTHEPSRQGNQRRGASYRRGGGRVRDGDSTSRSNTDQRAKFLRYVTRRLGQPVVIHLAGTQDLGSKQLLFDSHWSSLAYTSKHSGQELRLAEPIKELKMPPGLEWKGSKTLKTATAEATGVGFFEFLQLIEQSCKEHNIPPTNYELRCAALLLGIQKVHLRVMVLPYVQDIGNYSVDGIDKWSELRRALLHQNASPHWRHALVTEWLNSLTQGNKQVSNYIADARHWSTILTMMLSDRQLLPEPLFVMLLAVLSHQSIPTKLEQYSCHQEKMSDTLAVLHLAEDR
jgi:hypothetical protein